MQEYVGLYTRYFDENFMNVWSLDFLLDDADHTPKIKYTQVQNITEKQTIIKTSTAAS